MKEHLRLLGFKVREKLTGLVGVVTSVSFDISGCVQGYVNPGVDKDNKTRDGCWYDTKRLEPLTKKSLLEAPTFEVVPGGQALPSPLAQKHKP